MNAVLPDAEIVLIEAPWTDPVEALAAFADEPYAALLSGGGWSYLARRPDLVMEPRQGEPLPDVPGLLRGGHRPDGPPWQGGVIGLASYELSARLEAVAPQVRGEWPDLTLARYPALLAFDHARCRVIAVGRGRQAGAALAWLDGPRRAAPCGPLGAATCDVADERHAANVANTVGRIAAGEMFQANLARPWRGRLAAGRTPYDLFRRLAHRSPAPYAAYWRLPGRALVSNSPERFLSVRDGWVESRPIKGTRPRGAGAVADAALAAELRASAKDRAENLMIVDLMRNDLAQVSSPGTVCVPQLAALESYANVHHLVSRVRARLAPGRTGWGAFLSAFPAGSVTGAPKLQAMKVIADYESPRGPYCGSLFQVGGDGSLDASVLIRTLACVEDEAGWRFEARAGGGIVADSEPAAEVAETTAKIGAILAALAADT